MSGYVDSRQKEILWDLLANPADNGSSYIQSLERLVQDNPQSGLLQVLLARVSDKKQLSKATVYYNPRALHKVMNNPQDLAVVDEGCIIHSPEDFYERAQNFFNIGTATTVDTDLDVVKNIENNEPQQNDVIATPVPESEPLQIIEEQEEVPIQIIEEPELAEVPFDSNNQPDAKLLIEDEPVEEITEAPVIGSEYNHTYHAFENAVSVKDETSTEPAPAIENTSLFEPEVTEEKAVEEEAPVPVQEEPYNQMPPIPQNEAPRFNARFPKPEAPALPAQKIVQPQQDIEDEVYDEIVSIEDIGFEQLKRSPAEPIAEARFSEPHPDTSSEEEEVSEVLFHQPQPVVETMNNEHKEIQEQEERLIFDSAIGADYLTYDKKLDELRGITSNNTPDQPVATQEAALVANVPAEIQASPQPAEPADQQVSRYDDDKMPYTFMWWLNKTRKEHAETFQPYANNQDQPADTKPASAEALNPVRHGKPDELQQQYYENIFSLTSVSGVERNTEPGSVAFDPNKKEDIIIERFIHSEPQIKPLSADKLDNENKAKKSSEDLNDYVTETLARIYCDQMLYHKAIATYKKLILKFPEKKLYFASQIEQLEKKTN